RSRVEDHRGLPGVDPVRPRPPARAEGERGETRRSVTRGQLGELDQDVAGGGWIEERDAAATMAGARLLVDQLDALGAQLVQRAVDVLDLEAEVEQALALLGDPLADRRVR